MIVQLALEYSLYLAQNSLKLLIVNFFLLLIKLFSEL